MKNFGKKIENIFFAVGGGFAVWAIFSWIEIICKNLSGLPISGINLWNLLF